MQFYFIRHGQSENNLKWAQTQSNEGRSPDPGLTAAGHQQAEHVAAFLSRTASSNGEHAWDPQNVHGMGITHLYTSLMTRAIQTGVPIAAALDLPLVAWAETHERGGIYELDETTQEPVGLPGPGRAHFEAHYPTLVLPETMNDAGWWSRPFEPERSRRVRARQFLETLLERHGQTDDHVALISHGGFYNEVLRQILRLLPDTDTWFTVNNTGITRIDFNTEGDRISFRYTNRVDFLPADLIT